MIVFWIQTFLRSLKLLNTFESTFYCLKTSLKGYYIRKNFYNDL